MAFSLLALASMVEAGEILVRVTYYHGSRTASGAKPVQGVTVAAENRYKFGSKLHIPGLVPLVGGSGEFTVQDRGPAVQKRTASRGKMPVIDVYVSSSAQVARLAKQKNNIFKIQIK